MEKGKFEPGERVELTAEFLEALDLLDSIAVQDPDSVVEVKVNGRAFDQIDTAYIERGQGGDSGCDGGHQETALDVLRKAIRKRDRKVMPHVTGAEVYVSVNRSA